MSLQYWKIWSAVRCVPAVRRNMAMYSVRKMYCPTVHVVEQEILRPKVSAIRADFNGHISHLSYEGWRMVKSETRRSRPSFENTVILVIYHIISHLQTIWTNKNLVEQKMGDKFEQKKNEQKNTKYYSCVVNFSQLLGDSSLRACTRYFVCCCFSLTLSLPKVINSNFPCSLTTNISSHSM